MRRACGAPQHLHPATMQEPRRYSIAIHGGAGTITREALSPHMEEAHREALILALAAGEAVLMEGGLAVDAVTAAVTELEDCELFNAGKGAVYNHQGTHELDASIMDGRNRRAGAAAGLAHVKNPVRLCRAIMNHSQHVFLMGEGAEAFAKEHGVVMVENDYFSTPFRKEQWLKAREQNIAPLDHSYDDLRKFGTVGAVAFDRQGNLAAATSTGGITNKKYGRVGDSPIIGAGTYAENGVCAVSATGHGEFFIRAVAAHEVAALIKHARMGLHAACNEVIYEVLPALGGDGGLIAIDRTGEIYMPFNTKGMYRASVRERGEPYVGIYREA